ncbi:DNA mismatch repair protein [Mortierella claussenii]|nr:DNA mismatch repair protein [Mortierella claussenii]
MALIQTLAPSVAEELRASLVVSSLEQCAAELVQNSIDANASSIEVKIDVAGHSLQVSDNGDGIAAIDMSRVGMRYATSKCSSLQDLKRITTYGFRGEVRQRYWSEASAAKIDQQLERVKRAVEALALVWPRISFTVMNMAKNTKIMACRKVDSQLHRIMAVLGQALSSSLTFVRSEEDPIYHFSGYISTVGHYNRLYQYIFLNNRPIQCDTLQKAIIQLFQQSMFAKESLHHDENTRCPRERHPVFVLALKCPSSEYDICTDPSKVTVDFEDEESMIYVVRSTIISFLGQQHLLSRSAASTLRNQTTIRKRKARGKDVVGLAEGPRPLGYFSRIKASRPSKTLTTPQHQSESNRSANEPHEIDLEDELEFELDMDWMADMLDDDFVNSVASFHPQGDGGAMLPTAASKTPTFTRASLPHAVKPRSKPYITRTSGIWAQDALCKWVNPVFPTPPNQVPSLKTLSLNTAHGDGALGVSIRKSTSRFFSTGATQQGNFDIQSLQLSKACLQHARVVAQLDKKFILCTMDASTLVTQFEHGALGSIALVVVDQHAADERVRVERLMKKMCVCSNASVLPLGGAETSVHRVDRMNLVPPLPITLSRRERKLAGQYAHWLRRWGITLDSTLPPKLAGAHQRHKVQQDQDMEEASAAETVLVSHHFSAAMPKADIDPGRIESSPSFQQRQEGTQTMKPTPIIAPVNASESEYSRVYVTALPRLTADRCVLDTTLTQDLIKDSISWAEESQFNSTEDCVRSVKLAAMHKRLPQRDTGHYQLEGL